MSLISAFVVYSVISDIYDADSVNMPSGNSVRRRVFSSVSSVFFSMLMILFHTILDGCLSSLVLRQ